MKIEFGGGKNKSRNRDGFLQVDVQDLPHVDIVADAVYLLDHFKENTVDEIYHRHFFEHLTFAQGKKFLADCLTIMKPSARHHFLLPNLERIFPMYESGKTDLARFRGDLFGWQAGSIDDLWDVHKALYFIEDMDALLVETGYTNIQTGFGGPREIIETRNKKSKGKHLIVEAYKHE